jgi:D-amino-acid dehydrogenase
MLGALPRELHSMRDIIVIGGGVIGLTTALWLLEAGHRVTLVERAVAPGAGASYANGGQLSYRYVAPFADRGVPLKALRWLFQDTGPLRFKPQCDAHQWRWLAAFLAHCRADTNRATTARLLALGALSRQSLGQLADVVPPQRYAWREAGKLVVYRRRKTFDAATARNDGGVVWTPTECAAHEPALAAVAHQLAGGVYHPGEAVADCHAFCTALAEQIAAHPRCAGVVQAQVERIVTERGRVTGLRTTAGVLAADAYVLAAGIGSRALAAGAGIGLPLYPLKGYSLSAPIRPGDVAPSISVTDFERKVLYARIGDGLRVAAMVDLVGEDARIDPRRLDSLVRQVRSTMPQAADYGRIVPWAGLRPATPSGAPIIGATPCANLWLNVGHGGLGFTFACGSARVLADLMDGKAAPIAMAGLTLD